MESARESERKGTEGLMLAICREFGEKRTIIRCLLSSYLLWFKDGEP